MAGAGGTPSRWDLKENDDGDDGDDGDDEDYDYMRMILVMMLRMVVIAKLLKFEEQNATIPYQ